VIKRLSPAGLLFIVAACGGGDGGAGPNTQPSDISSMAVGDVRVLNSTDIPNGISLPASSSARDYLIVVGNTNTAHDVVANYVVKADRSQTGVFGVETAANMLASRYSLSMDQVPLARTAPCVSVTVTVQGSALESRARKRTLPGMAPLTLGA